ncbi:hypothetical protein MASR1M65_04280 [Saprospiraceae bacterium]
MLTSILTRVTGHALVAGVLLEVVVAAGTRRLRTPISPPPMRLRPAWFGDLVFTGSLWAVWYHYLAGLRHLYYDAGHGLDIPTAEKLGWICLIGSVVLTVDQSCWFGEGAEMRYLTARKRAEGKGAAHSGTERHWSLTLTAVGLAFTVPVWLYIFGRALGGSAKRCWPPSPALPGDPDRAGAGGRDAPFANGRHRS